MADDAGVRIRLLGGFEVTVAGRPVAADAWRLRKAKTLVKLLALARGHRLHREALVAVLWPDRDGASATNNLHQALYIARRALAGTSGALCLRADVVLLSERACRGWTLSFRSRVPRAHNQDPQDYLASADCIAGTCCPRTDSRNGLKGHARPCTNAISACSWSTPTCYRTRASTPRSSASRAL